MSRRDTIIIAVLVNAAILLILFATAMRSDKKKEDTATPLVKEETCDSQELLAANSPDENVEDAAIEILGSEETEIPLDQAEAAKVAAPASVNSVAAQVAPKEPLALQPQKTGTDSKTKAQANNSALATDQKPTASSTPALAAPKAKALGVEVATEHAVASHEEMVKVSVKKGDALEKIARANHSTVAAIMKANNLSSTNLKIGQVLNVPALGKSVAPQVTALAPPVAKPSSTPPAIKAGHVALEKSPAPALAPSSQAKKELSPQVAHSSLPPAAPSEGYYTVKEGDSPWLIANRNGVKVEDLLRLNGMDNAKAKRLRPGDKLRIR